jgi:hypothetical protein
MLNATTQEIKRVYGKLQNSRLFASIAKDDITNIFAAQKNINTPANNSYAKAGFKAETITSRMVQNQIAYGAL